MMKEMLPFNHLEGSGIHDDQQYNFLEKNVKKQVQPPENYTSGREQQMTPFTGFETFDFDSGLSPFQLSQEACANLRNIHTEILELYANEQEKSSPSSLSSFMILNNCRSKNPKNIKVTGSDIACPKVRGRAVTEIIRLAGVKFIESKSLGLDLQKLTQNNYDEKNESVELMIIHHLLSSAEKIRERQFDCASELLNNCKEYSSDKGSPVQRLVHYFSAALRQKINLETGVTTSKMMSLEFFEEAILNPNSSSLSLHQRVPFCKVVEFSGMQAIIENVAEAMKIHIIDLDIKSGMQWSIFIQHLASRHLYPVEHLKITAVETESNTLIAETGRRLENFAESMDLSFSFHVVIVTDMLDLNEDLFELDINEVTAVYSSYFLWTMIGQQDRLECLMRVIRNIKPCLMVVNETEVNHNSPLFVNRFVDTLFFFGAYFDCLGDCMDPNDPNRLITESVFGHGLCNIVAAKGKERRIRQVKNNVWASFFSRFNMLQKEWSRSSLYKASLVLTDYECEASCSLNMDGKSLIVGWKGTPLLSLCLGILCVASVVSLFFSLETQIQLCMLSCFVFTG